MRLRAIAWVTVFTVSACGIDFESSSEVLDRRVLAISAEPAELVLEEGVVPGPVVVRALVGDVTGSAAPVEYEWRSCVPAGGSEAGYDALAGRCDEKVASTLLEQGTKTLELLGVSVPVPEAIVSGVRGLAAARQPISLYLDAQLRLGPASGPTYALKRIVVSPPVPAGRVANHNPKLAAVLFDGEPWEPGVVKKLSHGACEQKVGAVDPTKPGVTSAVCEHRIDPVFDDAQAEAYRVQTFDTNADGSPVVLELQERLRFSWFSNAGTVSRGGTQQPGALDQEQADPLSTRWREPPAKPAGRVTIWVVVRDGRGGTSWEARSVEFE